MKVSVSQIRMGSANDPYEVEETVDVSELETMNNDIRRIEPAQVKATFTTERDEIMVSLEVKGEMILPCARTLVDVPYRYDFTANEIFSTSPYLTEEDQDNEIHPVQGEIIDLTSQIKENILLNTPFRVFSDEENPEGGAPTAGKGWSFVQKESKEKTIDPRLKKLESLLENNKKENE